MTNAEVPRVVILGGGFAGLRVALWLARHASPDECAITLVDRESAHVNPTWLYEVATAFNPFEREAVGSVLHESASVPFERIFRGSGIVYLQRTVDHVDLATRTVRLVRLPPQAVQQANQGPRGGVDEAESDVLAADVLVLALGSQLNTFKVQGVEAHAFSIKTLHEAIELRHHLVRQFLKYRSASSKRQERAFRVAVVGGGSAGTELAAELAGFLQRLARLHSVDLHLPRVVLFEASDTLLHEYPEVQRARGFQRLRSLGVEVRRGASVCAVGPDHLACQGGILVPSDTVVWLAGIRTHDCLLRLGLPVHPRGGVYVERTLEVSGVANVFAAGDCVYAEDRGTGRTVPDVAYAAVQQGTVVAQNVLRRLRGQHLISYVDRPRPTYATVGGKFALVHRPPFQFSGKTGWYVKQLADLKYLFSILPNDLAFRRWLKGVRVRVAND